MDHTLTVADGLFSDERIKEAKKLLIEAVKSHQAKLTGVKPPNPALKVSYDELLAKFANYRAANLWFPYLGSGIGNGSLVELLDGSVKYDFICGIGPHFFGHSHPDVIASGIDAAISNTVMQGHLQQNGDSVEITEFLINQSKMPHCFLTNAGAMANENALKIAFQKNFPASRVLAFERCFVGRTLAVTQITDKAAFREGLPPTLAVDYVPFFDPERPQESTKEAVNALKKYIYRYPKQHAIMCFELIQGEGGFYSGTKEFYISLMTILKENNIAVFDDEVQSFSRTTELFACHYFGLEKYVDIISIGKSSQLCATLFSEDYKPRPGLLSQTFTASTSAIRASLTMLKGLVDGGYYGSDGRIAKIHRYFVDKLEDIAKRHPHLIKGPYGTGCMIAFTPLSGEVKTTTKFVLDLFENGVMSFIAGGNPTRVRFLVPAGAVTFADIDAVSKIIEKTLLES